MRPRQAIAFAQRWGGAHSGEQKAALFAQRFVQVARRADAILVIQDRSALSAYWAQVLERRRRALAPAHLTFACHESRLALYYAPIEGSLLAEEADVLELDERGLVKRSEIYRVQYALCAADGEPSNHQPATA